MAKGGFGETMCIQVRREGTLLGSRVASISACREDALFEGILSGRIPNDGTLPVFSVVPIFSEEPNPPEASGDAGARNITGVELGLEADPPRRYRREVFAAQARGLIDSLVKDGKLDASARVEWSLVECPADTTPSRFGARVSRKPLPLSPARLPRLSVGEVGVELEPALLDRLRREFCQAGPVERAWLLVGSVDHDPERGAAAIRAVTAVDVEMGRGGASRTHFAFEPAPFVEARERALREFDGLVPIGWAHSHPPCEACPANPACASDTRFFSAADVEVHTSAFASPYMIALVAGKVAAAPATEPGFSLFGWRQAQIEELGFRVAGPGH